MVLLAECSHEDGGVTAAGEVEGGDAADGVGAVGVVWFGWREGKVVGAGEEWSGGFAEGGSAEAGDGELLECEVVLGEGLACGIGPGVCRGG